MHLLQKVGYDLFGFGRYCCHRHAVNDLSYGIGSNGNEHRMLAKPEIYPHPCVFIYHYIMFVEMIQRIEVSVGFTGRGGRISNPEECAMNKPNILRWRLLR